MGRPWALDEQPPRVAIVDDNDVFAESLAVSLLLASDVHVRTVRPVGSLEEALGEVLSWRTDVVVVDLRVAETWTGEQLASALEQCGTKVVVATAVPDPALPREFHGPVFDKTHSRSELVRLITEFYPEAKAS